MIPRDLDAATAAHDSGPRREAPARGVIALPKHDTDGLTFELLSRCISFDEAHRVDGVGRKPVDDDGGSIARMNGVEAFPRLGFGSTMLDRERKSLGATLCCLCRQPDTDRGTVVREAEQNRRSR